MTANHLDGPATRADMRRLRVRARAVAAILICLSAVPSHAAQGAWERVGNLAGTPVVITTTSGSTVQGKLESTTADALVLAVESGGQRSFTRADILTLSAIKRDSVWPGVLAGAALGFGAGSGLGAAWYYGSGRYGAKPPGYAKQFITGIGVLGAIAGAVVGWRVDAAHARAELVYDARRSLGRDESAKAAGVAQGGMPSAVASTDTIRSHGRLLDALGAHPSTTLVREYILTNGGLGRTYASELPLDEAPTAVSWFYRYQLLDRQWTILGEHAAASEYTQGDLVFSILRLGPEDPGLPAGARLVTGETPPADPTFFFAVEVAPRAEPARPDPPDRHPAGLRERHACNTALRDLDQALLITHVVIERWF